MSAAAAAGGNPSAWGANTAGQLGYGSAYSNTPGYSRPAGVSTLDQVSAVAAGNQHSLALRSDGTVWAWGSNLFGQLGAGTAAPELCFDLPCSLGPAYVPLGGAFTAVAAGGSHSLALKSDGTVWAWGSNLFGQLGDGGTADRALPVQVAGLSGVQAVAAGGSHSLALKSDGTVWAWGSNSSGQLGVGDNAGRTLPVQVSAPGTFAQVAAGAEHSLALRSDGTVWAWGSNSSGQAGAQLVQELRRPERVNSLSNASAIAAGAFHSLALQQDTGTVWAWGANAQGQLGDGTTDDKKAPIQAVSLGQARAIAGGAGHSLAIGPLLPRPTPVPTPGPTPSPTPGPEADTFEPDDTPQQAVDNARVLTVDGPAQQRTLHVAGDEDWVYLNVQQNQTLELSAQVTGTPDCDTVLDIFRLDGAGLVGDDDGGLRFTSRLVHTFSGAGTYALRVRNYVTDSAAAGQGTCAYGLSARSAVAPTATPVPTLAPTSTPGPVWALRPTRTPSPTFTPTATPPADATAVSVPNVIGSVRVSSQPGAITLDPDANRVYISRYVGRSVSVIDGRTNAVVTDMSVSGNPSGLAFDPATKRLYVATSNRNSVAVLDTLTGGALGSVSVGENPIGVSVNPSTGRVFTANKGADSVSVFDSSTLQVVSTLGVGSKPYGVEVNPVTGRTYVANSGGTTVSVIDSSGSRVAGTIPVGSGPWVVGVNRATNRIYVSNSNDGTVSVLDGANDAVIGTVSVGRGPQGVKANPTTNRVFVANYDDDTVSVIDGSTSAIVTVLPVGNKPTGVAVNPVTNQVYVTNSGDGSVSVIQDYLPNQAPLPTPTAAPTSQPSGGGSSGGGSSGGGGGGGSSGGGASGGGSDILTAPGRPVVVYQPAAPDPLLQSPTGAQAGGSTAPLLATPEQDPPVTWQLPIIIPDSIPPIPADSGGQMLVLLPDASARVAIAAEPSAPLGVRMDIGMAFDRPLIVRLVPNRESVPVGAGQTLPMGLPLASFELSLYTHDGTPITELSQPVRICGRVPDALMQATGGELDRAALLRFNTARQSFERLPSVSTDPTLNEVCAETVETSTFALGVLPAEVAARPVQDPRYFPETGFRIEDDAIYWYFQQRGGLRAFGYPVSRQFQLLGTAVQFFQRRVLQRFPDGTVQQLNFLDPDLFPFRRINGSQFPELSPTLKMLAPEVGETNFDLRALSFVRSHTTDAWEGRPVDFKKAYLSTVTCADAFPEGSCDEGLLELMNFDMWGFPISEPTPDPANPDFIYQAFQRGILHFDATTGLTQGILMGDLWKALITGQGLPADLDVEALGTPFWRQFNPLNPLTGMRRPAALQGTNMAAAFARDVPREEVSASALAGGVSARAPGQGGPEPGLPVLGFTGMIAGLLGQPLSRAWRRISGA